MFRSWFALIPALLLLGISSVIADTESDYAALQGKWTGEIYSENGTAKLELNLTGKGVGNFKLANLEGQVMIDGAIRFNLHRVGEYGTFEVTELVPPTGDKAGQNVMEGGKAVTVLYRLHEGHFYTLSGFGQSESSKPSLIEWNRQD